MTSPQNEFSNSRPNQRNFQSRPYFQKKRDFKESNKMMGSMNRNTYEDMPNFSNNVNDRRRDNNFHDKHKDNNEYYNSQVCQNFSRVSFIPNKSQFSYEKRSPRYQQNMSPQRYPQMTPQFNNSQSQPIAYQYPQGQPKSKNVFDNMIDLDSD